MTRSARRILLLADHKWRDLPGLVYLKLLLERHHECAVRIASFHAAEEETLLFRPHLVVFNNMFGSAHVTRSKRFREMGIATAVLPTEGWAPYDEVAMYFAGKFTDLSSVALHFVWSERVRRRMVELGTLPRERVVVSGVPRFDFYRPPLCDLFQSKAHFCREYELPAERPIVSLATNFSTAKFSQANQSFLEADWKNLGFSELSRAGDPQGWARMEWQSREIMLGVMKEVIHRFPELSFVIKPHPAEDVEIYHAFIRGLGGTNVRLVGGKYIWDLLNATDLHLSRGCTTGIEAWFLNKATVEIHFDPEDPWFFEEIAAGSDVATDAASLGAAIRRHIGGSVVTAEQHTARQAYIEQHFSRLDGRRSAACASALAACLETNNGEPKVTWSRADLKRLLARGVRQLLKIQPDRAVRDWRRWYAATDAIGQWDKTHRPADIRSWENRIRPLVDGSRLGD